MISPAPAQSETATPQFKTSLLLSPAQEKKFLDFVVSRLKDCCRDQGRQPLGATEPGSWLDVRRTNQLSFEGDYKWRLDALGGAFIDGGNLSFGDGKRYTLHLAASVTDDLLSTSPFFGAMNRKGATPEKEQLVKAIEEEVQCAVEESNVPDVLREACELALARNEAVVKLRNVFDASGYIGPADVLVDPTGNPIITPAKQLFIYREDDMLPLPDQAGMVALEKDPSFIVSEQARAAFQYAHFEDLPQTQVMAEGLDARIIDPRDFICPLTANSIHEADIVAHFYDETDTKLKETYEGFDVSSSYFNRPESGANAPIESQGERLPSGTELNWRHIGEVYVRFDADEDGRAEEILLVMDRDVEKSIFYDYLPNHMKKRPFEVIHGLRKVPGRWYGVGVFSDLADQLLYIDKTLCRINAKNNKTASATFAQREMVEEWSTNDGPIVLGDTTVLTLSRNWSEEKGQPIIRVNLVEVSEEEVALMNEMRQSADQTFGVISAADASARDMNQSKTATGITNLERSSNKMVKKTERVQMVGITAILEQAVDLVLEALDPTTLVLTKQSALISLNREEIRSLPRDVKLLLTRSKATDMLATNEAAGKVANEFWDLKEQRPIRAKAMRGFYINRLRALEIIDADEILPEVTDEDIAQWQQAQAQGQQQQTPPSERIMVNLKDLIGQERVEALAMFGIKADQHAMAAEQTQQAQAQAAKTAPFPKAA